MIVDSSAVVAVVLGEVEADAFRSAMALDNSVRMSAATLVEATMVIEGRTSPQGSQLLDELVEDASISIEPVTVEQAQEARRAWRRFGKGNHAAALNFGDCFSYALAKTMDEPLLFKGKDFAQTDVKSAS